MRSALKTAVIVVMLVALGGFYWWRQREAASAEAEQQMLNDATKAMVEVNRSNSELPTKMAEAQNAIITAALTSIPAAGAAITAKLVPPLDDYLGKLDHALALAEAYRAHHGSIDPTVAKSLDTLHARAKAMHDTRDQLNALAARASSGAVDSDGLAKGLAAASLAAISP